jgi:hypothetical protein
VQLTDTFISTPLRFFYCTFLEVSKNSSVIPITNSMALEDEDKKKRRVDGEEGDVAPEAVEGVLDEADDDEADPMIDPPEGDDDKWE